MIDNQLIIVLIIITGSLLKAEASHSDELGKDIREECRATVSGAYLNVVSDYHSLAGSIRYLNEKSKKLKSLKTELEKEKAKLAQTENNKKFDIKILEQVSVTKAKLLATDKESSLVDKELIRQKEAFKRAEFVQKEMEKKMQPIFSITRKTPRSEKAGKYIIEVAYHYQCQRFRFLCPLPENQRQALKILTHEIEGLFPKEAYPIACERYANILPRRH